MSIRLGDYEFTEPVRIESWVPPPRSGLFAVLVPDPTPSISGRPFSPLYIGYGANMTRQDFLTNHEKRDCWTSQAPAGADLYVAVLLMRDKSDKELAATADALARQFRPPCND